MARQRLGFVPKVLALLSGIVVLVGFGLIVYFTYTEAFDDLTFSRTRESERFLAVLFLILWLCCFFAALLDNIFLILMAGGLFATIMVYAYPFNALRHVLQNMNTDSDLVFLAAGGLLCYIGTLLVFVVPAAHNFRRTNPSTWLATSATLLADVFGVCGCVLVWSTSDIDFDKDAGRVLFHMTEGMLAVLFVLNTGVFLRLEVYCFVSVVLNGLFGVPLLHDFLNVMAMLQDELSEAEYNQNVAATACLFISALLAGLAAFRPLEVQERVGYLTIA